MLHIQNCIVDDPKFIDNMIDVFDYTRGNHEVDYCYVTDKEDYKLHLKKSERVTIIKPSDFIDYIIEHHINVVMMHSMNSLPHSILLRIPEPIKVVWFAWGYDLYRFPVEEKPLIKLPLFKPLTAKVRNSDRVSYLARKKTYINYLLKNRRCIRKAISRVDFFSGVIEMEYDLMCKNSFFRAEQLFFNYFKLPESEAKTEDVATNGNNIVLGNSASAVNNHIDVLEYLKGMDLADRTIIMPFSYQRSKDYVEKVKSYCEKNFCNIFVLEKFMPLDKYNELLSSCGYAIYFFESQAGMGNVLQSIMCGRKVFLSETSIVYKYFKSLGCEVYSVQSQLSCKELSTPLDREMVQKNRSAIYKRWSSSVLLSNINRTFDIIERKVKNEIN